jgi:hypothetical protein
MKLISENKKELLQFLHIGIKIKIISDLFWPSGDIGIIKNIEQLNGKIYTIRIAVDFPFSSQKGHDCNGFCKNGWFLHIFKDNSYTTEIKILSPLYMIQSLNL